MGVRPLHAKSVCKCIQIVNLEEVAAVFPGPDGIEPDLSGSGPAEDQGGACKLYGCQGVSKKYCGEKQRRSRIQIAAQCDALDR